MPTQKTPAQQLSFQAAVPTFGTTEAIAQNKHTTLVNSLYGLTVFKRSTQRSKVVQELQLQLCQTPEGETPLSPKGRTVERWKDERPGWLRRLRPLAIRLDVFTKHRTRIFLILRSLLGGSIKQAQIVQEALYIIGKYGTCFGSARFLAKQQWSSKRTFWRAIGILREHGLAATTPLMKPDGRYSTNLLDLSILWRLILKLLAAHAHPGFWDSNPFSTRSGTFKIRVRGNWLTLFDALLDGPPTDAVMDALREGWQRAVGEVRRVRAKIDPKEYLRSYEQVIHAEGGAA